MERVVTPYGQSDTTAWKNIQRFTVLKQIRGRRLARVGIDSAHRVSHGEDDKCGQGKHGVGDSLAKSKDQAKRLVPYRRTTACYTWSTVLELFLKWSFEL